MFYCRTPRPKSFLRSSEEWNLTKIFFENLHEISFFGIISVVDFDQKIFFYTVKTHVKWYATIPGTWVTREMSHWSGTHLLTRLVQHATPSESGPTKACSFTRDNPWSIIVACHYFTYDPPRRGCPNDLACMDPLIMACYMGMLVSIRTAGFMGIWVFRVPLYLTRGCIGYKSML